MAMVDRRLHVLENKRPKDDSCCYAYLLANGSSPTNITAHYTAQSRDHVAPSIVTSEGIKVVQINADGVYDVNAIANGSEAGPGDYLKVTIHTSVPAKNESVSGDDDDSVGASASTTWGFKAGDTIRIEVESTVSWGIRIGVHYIGPYDYVPPVET